MTSRPRPPQEDDPADTNPQRSGWLRTALVSFLGVAGVTLVGRAVIDLVRGELDGAEILASVLGLFLLAAAALLAASRRDDRSGL